MKVDREIQENIVRDDSNKDDFAEENKMQMRRFKELQRDFTSDDRYKTRNIDTHLEEEPEHE